MREVYLTLEIFAGTSETPGEILAKLRGSVAYRRAFVPRDGMSLEDLVRNAASTPRP